MKTSKEYRLQACAALEGKYGLAIGMTLVYGALLSACSFTTAGIIVLGGAFTLGNTVAYMRLTREGILRFADLFSGFGGTVGFGKTIGVNVLTALFGMLWGLLLVVPGVIAAYRYSQVYYILADHPEMSPMDAIRASKELMKGKKGRLFCLDLSYFGWMLLCCLTLGILSLWVSPRIQAAHAAFYEDIKNEVPVFAEKDV